MAPPALLRLAHLPTSLALICPGLEPGISGRLHDQALPREQRLAAQCSRGKNGRLTDGGIQAMAIEGKAASCRPQDQGPLNPSAPRVVPSPSNAGGFSSPPFVFLGKLLLIPLFQDNLQSDFASGRGLELGFSGISGLLTCPLRWL